MLEIDTGQIGEGEWLHVSKELVDRSNLICITKEEFKTSDYNPLIWFGTNLIQFVARSGDSEICPLFGKHINNVNDFAYQLCRTIPWGFEMGRNIHAIYDVVLNFTTEPKNRYFIWYDAQHLFNLDRQLFDKIYESLIVAAYLNTNGKATHDYRVNQKVIFLFDETEEEAIRELCEKDYYTPAISDHSASYDEQFVLHKQLLVTVK
jgi:RNAse (barnase) inhibitor barstar